MACVTRETYEPNVTQPNLDKMKLEYAGCECTLF